MNALNRVYCNWQLRRFAKRIPDQARLVGELRTLLRQRDLKPEDLKAEMHRLFEEARIRVVRSKEAEQVRLKESFEAQVAELGEQKGRDRKREQLNTLYAGKKQRVMSRLEGKLAHLPPSLPEGGSKLISLEVVERKALAKQALERLHHLLADYPATSVWVRTIAFLLVALGSFANFYFITAILGPDWVSGKETLSALVSGLFALLLSGAEVIGISMILAYLKEPYGALWSRRLQAIGGLLIFVGILVFMWSRSAELGAVMNPTSLGIIE